MTLGKIESLGAKAQKKVIKLSVEGLSYQTIADELSKEYNTDVTCDEVETFKRRNKNKSLQILKEDKHFQTKLVETYFNTIGQLKDINSEIFKLFYELRKNPDEQEKLISCPNCNKKIVVKLKNYLTLLKTADTLLKQIEHVDKILGRLQKKSFNISYNYTDLSKKIAIALPELLYGMEKRGIVKINKKRLKLYEGRKMSYEEPEAVEEEDEEDWQGNEEPIEA